MMEAPTDKVPRHRTPDEELADLICEKLQAADLIPSNRQTAVNKKLASGTANRDDWQLWVDMAINRKNKEEDRHEQA